MRQNPAKVGGLRRRFEELLSHYTAGLGLGIWGLWAAWVAARDWETNVSFGLLFSCVSCFVVSLSLSVGEVDTGSSFLQADGVECPSKPPNAQGCCTRPRRHAPMHSPAHLSNSFLHVACVAQNWTTKRLKCRSISSSYAIGPNFPLASGSCLLRASVSHESMGQTLLWMGLLAGMPGARVQEEGCAEVLGPGACWSRRLW